MGHRRARTLVAACLPVLLVAGCSGGGDDGGGGGPGPASRQGTSEGRDREGPGGDSGETPAKVTIGASGDLLAHQPVVEDARANAGGSGYDFAPMFDDVRGLIEEPDASICHMETPLSPDDTDLAVPGTLVFNTPHELADAVSGAGYNGCDFASNHSWDRLLEGVGKTRSVLEGAGLQYVGPEAKEAQADHHASYDAGRAKIAQLAYSYTLYNSAVPTTQVPPEAPWLKRGLWPAVGAKGILEDARRAKRDGADFVVVSMHWGTEYETRPTRQQRSIAKQLLESDEVDLILGTHVHVVQPCEKINGKYVLYGMGNFLSNQSPDTDSSLGPETQEGLFARVSMERGEGGEVTSSMTYQPTRVRIEDHLVERATKTTHPRTYERVTSTMAGLGGGSCDARPMG